MKLQANEMNNKNEIIVIVHGLIRSSKSMLSLGKHLNEIGYEIIFYDYPSTKYNIAEHSKQLNLFIQSLLFKNHAKKVHFITHSLGGIITREALNSLTGVCKFVCVNGHSVL